MAKALDTTKPNIARMYDYWLGGKDNFAVDRQAAEAVREQRPDVAVQALDNKKFLTRAVTYIAGQGVRQFLDVGSGLPTSPAWAGTRAPWLATHQAAEAVVADPVVAYIDYDQVAVLHSQALLTGGSHRVVAVGGDMHDVAEIFAHDEIRAAGFDPNEPACVILACVLHFADGPTARRIVTSFAEALAPGSYLVMSLGFAKGHGGEDFARTYNAQGGARIYAQTWEMITALFDGLELVVPGIVDSATWRAGWQETGHPDRPSIIAAGVGRRA
jgi:O-methyltransferase involved in polyketide biosynthesis